MKVNILIIDYNETFLQTASRVFRCSHIWIGKVATEQTVDENFIVETAKTLPLNLILLDSQHPDYEPLKILKSLKQSFPQAHVICTATTDDPKLSKFLIREGASDFLVHPISKTVLLKTIENSLQFVESQITEDSVMVSKVAASDEVGPDGRPKRTGDKEFQDDRIQQSLKKGFGAYYALFDQTLPSSLWVSEAAKKRETFLKENQGVLSFLGLQQLKCLPERLFTQNTPKALRSYYRDPQNVEKRSELITSLSTGKTTNPLEYKRVLLFILGGFHQGTYVIGDVLVFSEFYLKYLNTISLPENSDGAYLRQALITLLKGHTDRLIKIKFHLKSIEKTSIELKALPDAIEKSLLMDDPIEQKRAIIYLDSAIDLAKYLHRMPLFFTLIKKMMKVLKNSSIKLSGHPYHHLLCDVDLASCYLHSTMVQNLNKASYNFEIPKQYADVYTQKTFYESLNVFKKRLRTDKTKLNEKEVLFFYQMTVVLLHICNFTSWKGREHFDHASIAFYLDYMKTNLEKIIEYFWKPDVRKALVLIKEEVSVQFVKLTQGV